MGCVANVDAGKFPTQGKYLNKRCVVHFHYGREDFYGTIIRDDMESPGNGTPPLTIILLDDRRVVLSTECQYSPL